MFVFLCYLCAFLIGATTAADKCFCSATGDPHIRNFDGATSRVGAGDFILAEDKNFKYKVVITSVAMSPTLTQISGVEVTLAGDVVENIPGYGQVHRANGIEIRVLKNNNVFMIYDGSKGIKLKSGTLCGTCAAAAAPAAGTAAAAAAAAAPQKKAVALVKEIKKQQMELENLNVAQVTTDFAVNDMKNVSTKWRRKKRKQKRDLNWSAGQYNSRFTQSSPENDHPDTEQLDVF